MGMLFQYLQPKIDHVNGIWNIVESMGNNVIFLYIAIGSKKGNRFVLPLISCQSGDDDFSTSGFRTFHFPIRNFMPIWSRWLFDFWLQNTSLPYSHLLCHYNKQSAWAVFQWSAYTWLTWQMPYTWSAVCCHIANYTSGKHLSLPRMKWRN